MICTHETNNFQGGKLMRLRLIALSLVGTLFSTLPLAAADDSQPSLDRLKTAAALTALDGERDTIQCHDASKRFGDVAEIEHGLNEVS